MTDVDEPIDFSGSREPQPVPMDGAKKAAPLTAEPQVKDAIVDSDISTASVTLDPLQADLGHIPTRLEDTTSAPEVATGRFPVRITARGGESVAQYVRATYGFISEPLIRLILVHNPHIRDVQRLQAGAILILPAPDALID